MPIIIIDNLNNNIEFGNVLFIPILQDHVLHRCENKICFIYVYDLDSKLEYIINISHHDYLQTSNLNSIKSAFQKNIYVFNKSYIFNIFPNAIDINLIHWIKFNVPIEIELTQEILIYHSWFNSSANINCIIPMMNWLLYCRNIKAQTLTLIKDFVLDESYHFYNINLLNNLYLIENSGLTTDPNLTERYINKHTSKLYCQYNMYTSTGRPSNHFNSINFAALNKSTGIRSMIIPSSTNGWLVEFDYDSMHVRLIANLIKHTLPLGNLHEYFGRFYFKTPVIDKEMYEKSKNITWRLLYGNIDYEYLTIPFFKHIYEYRKALWLDFKKNGFIEMPLSNRKIYKSNFDSTLTSNILFNYLLQGHETEYNSLMLGNIFKYLYKKKSKLILYTYDSFLFDYDVMDGKDFLKEISSIINQNGFQSTIKYGKNYHIMKRSL